MTELKMVTRRREVCATVLALARRARERSVQEVTSSGGDRPDAAAQTMPDFAENQLTPDRDTYLHAAGAHESEKAVGRRVRAHRDEALAELRQGYVAFRCYCLGIYGEKAGLRLGFPSRTPQKTEELCRILKHVAETLEDPAFQREHPVPGYVQVDPETPIRDVRSLVKEAEGWLSEVEDSRERLKLFQEEREQAQRVLDASIRVEGRILLVYFEYAEMDDEVRMVREELRKLR